jgi:hypothetical protein
MNPTTFLGDRPVNRVGHGAMQPPGPGVFGPPRPGFGVRTIAVGARRDSAGRVLPAERPDELGRRPQPAVPNAWAR